MAVRRADGDEHRVGTGNRRRRVGGEAEPAGGDVGFHQHLEPGFEDGNLAPAQTPDLVFVAVDADHLDPELGEARAGDEPDVAGADHHDAHGPAILFSGCNPSGPAPA